MSQSPLETLKTAIEAIESKDIDKLMSVIDETCTIYREKNIVLADGVDAIRSFYAAAMEGFPNFKVEIREHFEIGTVLMVHEVNSRSDDGTKIDSTWAYQVRDGKFMLMHMFDPSTEMNELLSSAE